MAGQGVYSFDMSMSGKVAFITGATRGVGRCLALALAKAGCSVVVTGKTTEETPNLPGTIHSVAREIEALGVRALPVQLDVRDDAQVERAVKSALDGLGRIDYLINNAGALHWHALSDTPMKRFDLVMGVNARASFACARAVLPGMLAQGYGHIVMMSPPIEPKAAGGKIAYALSKFGMTLIAHGLADELKGQNVAANALWPATMIESYATINWGLGDRKMWRSPEILADSVLRIFAKVPKTFSGHALIDQDFLESEGVTDFTKYRCDPDVEPPRVPFDFKFAAGRI